MMAGGNKAAYPESKGLTQILQCRLTNSPGDDELTVEVFKKLDERREKRKVSQENAMLKQDGDAAAQEYVKKLQQQSSTPRSKPVQREVPDGADEDDFEL
eukprot:gnl/TRDRNA2_/TRDRNA2_140388_c0_seq2.p1 gnl/TRDRNA2_/TRDRNA2_140388_c0~~gnl/TRDRNA2_/TRDRNA2_140388_c0_seq2.p1  ORF type:complete len:100 (-),score=19.36 gnl/TRDRNA2_/TRDRNA2_140388_c0_seq2:71-370(-)